MTIVLIVIGVLVVLFLLWLILGYNGLGLAPEPGGQRVVADRRAAQAPLRPHPEPGRDGEGLRRPRAGHASKPSPTPAPTPSTRRGPEQQAQAENQLTGALKSLFAVAEAYPDLKANQNFLNLQEELTSTEDRIAYARQFYNDSVVTYNTKIQPFPTVILANMFNFEKREFFDAEPGDTEPVQVQF